MEVMDEHAPGFDRERTTVKDSGKGRFQSVTVYITATGVEQLETIHQALRANPVTKVVL
jgi:putative lipoic acid-binding regulatory protein